MECVFACDADAQARKAYRRNYGVEPSADVREIDADDVPDHDLLCAGFPCQPFSIIGERKGFRDMRGTLFFEIVRLLEAKRPRRLLLENVRQLVSHDGGNTMRRILNALNALGYDVDWRILNALDFGLPQKRERVLIVGGLGGLGGFRWPQGRPHRQSLADVLESDPDPRTRVSERIRRRRQAACADAERPYVCHENKGGNVTAHSFSCALRAGASYNYLLVNGERRLSEREMLSLQGFPEEFEIVCSRAETRKQAGNAVPVPMIADVIDAIRLAEEPTHGALGGDAANPIKGHETRSRGAPNHPSHGIPIPTP